MKALPNLWRWLPQPTLWSTFCNSSFLALATFKPLLTDPAMNGNQPWLLKQHQIIWERGEVGVLLLFPNPYVIICIFGKFKRSKMKIGPLSIKEGCCNNGVFFFVSFLLRLSHFKPAVFQFQRQTDIDFGILVAKSVSGSGGHWAAISFCPANHCQPRAAAFVFPTSPLLYFSDLSICISSNSSSVFAPLNCCDTP